MNYIDWCSLVSSCTKCELSKTRKQVVIGDGDPENCKIVAIGEAPGADEDEQGLPFVGRSGKLLRQVLDDLDLLNITYITNIVKCRPPNNRDPLKEELNFCGYYVIQQIEEYIKPEFILGIGRISSGIIMDGYVQKFHHGKLFDFGEYKFMGTYHPAAAMRSKEWKNMMVADLTYLGSKV
jgi:DNA polymerase